PDCNFTHAESISVPYTVSPGDVVSGDITATVDYTAERSHTRDAEQAGVPSAHTALANTVEFCTDDGKFCNGTETCSGGACVHSGDPCPTGPECNNHTCNETTHCATPPDTSRPASTNVSTNDACYGSGA